MYIAYTVFWVVWLLMLLIGDPLWIHFGGEKASDTHFLVTHIGMGLRIAILAWLAYHFIIAHRTT